MAAWEGSKIQQDKFGGLCWVCENVLFEGANLILLCLFTRYKRMFQIFWCRGIAHIAAWREDTFKAHSVEHFHKKDSSSDPRPF